GFDRLLVIGDGPSEMLAEVPGTAPRPLALMPGSYSVRARRGPRSYAVRVARAAGQIRTVAAEELAPTTVALASAKGELELGLPAPGPSSGLALAAAAGLRYGVFPGVPGAAVVRVALRGSAPSGFAVAV